MRLLSDELMGDCHVNPLFEVFLGLSLVQGSAVAISVMAWLNFAMRIPLQIMPYPLLAA